MTTATTTTNATDATSGSVLLTLMKLRTFIALFAVVAFFSIFAPNFLSTANLILMSKHVALNAFLAMGMTFVIITGGIDLSVGSIVGLCGMVAGGLILNGIDLQFGYTVYFNVVEVCLITLAVGIVIGAVNGLLITKLNVAPFIATLGTLYVRVALRCFHRAARHSPTSSASRNSRRRASPSSVRAGFSACRFRSGSSSSWRSPPHTRQVYADRSAHLRRRRQRACRPHVRHPGRPGEMFVYMFSGFCAAIVGLVISSELMASHPATGNSFELNAIAAAVLGGTSMSGGRGTIGGTIIGAFVIGILSDGLVMMGISSFWQMVIKGIVIIVAVVVDQAQRRLQQQVTLMQLAKKG